MIAGMDIAAKGQAPARLDITRPRRVTFGTVAFLSAQGLVLWVPVVLVSLVAVSGMSFGVLTFLVPLAAVAIATLFLPIGWGNPYIRQLLRSVPIPSDAEGETFIVQLTLSPRVRSGWRALMEDADDFGHLSFTGASVEFHGDSVNALIPFDQIQAIVRRNIGGRGLFLFSHRIVLTIPALTGIKSLEIAERSSWMLPESRVVTGRLFTCLSKAVAGRADASQRSQG